MVTDGNYYINFKVPNSNTTKNIGRIVKYSFEMGKAPQPKKSTISQLILKRPDFLPNYAFQDIKIMYRILGLKLKMEALERNENLNGDPTAALKEIA